MSTIAARPRDASSPRRPDPLRPWLRAFGVLCLFGALGMAAYMSWFLWGTGLLTTWAQEDLRRELEPRAVPASAPDRVVTVPGKGVAIMQIPKIGLDMVVVEGTDLGSLRKGPGHYLDTAYPWQRRGRVAIAGHRTTYAHPCWARDRLGPGDELRLLTEYGTFTYRVTRSAVVPFDAFWVLRQTEKPTLVLTTCHPKFSSAQRLAVFGNRVQGGGEGPRVVTPSGGTGMDQVGPGDNVGRAMAVSLLGSFGAGALYLGVTASLRARRQP